MQQNLTIQQKSHIIKSQLRKWDFINIQTIYEHQIINNIYNLFTTGTLPNITDKTIGIEFYYIGIFLYNTGKKEMGKKYLLNAINKEYMRAAVTLGYFVDLEGNKKDAVRYFKMAKHKISSAAGNLLSYYVKKNKEEKIKETFEIILKYNDLNDIANGLRHLGGWYYKQKKYDDMMKYLLDAIKFGSTDAPNDLANYYYDIVKDIDKAIMYYLIGIERNNEYAAYNLGNHYQSSNDTENMLKYWKMAVDLNHEKALLNLINYYKNKNDYHNALFYSKQLLSKYPNDIQYKNTFNEYIVNYRESGYKFESGCIFIKYMYELKDFLTGDNINYLNTHLGVYLLLRDISKSLEFNISDCCICLEVLEQLTLNCKHSVCYKCYYKITECPLCRKTI